MSNIKKEFERIIDWRVVEEIKKIIKKKSRTDKKNDKKSSISIKNKK